MKEEAKKSKKTYEKCEKLSQFQCSCLWEDVIMARVPKQEAALSLTSLLACHVPFFFLRNTDLGRVHDVSLCSDTNQKKTGNFPRISEI